MMVQQNKWRAARFGNQAMLVDTYTYQVAPVSQVVDEMVQKLRPTAVELCCETYLNHCVNLARQPSAAQRQLDILAETGDPREIVRRLTEAARVVEWEPGGERLKAKVRSGGLLARPCETSKIKAVSPPGHGNGSRHGPMANRRRQFRRRIADYARAGRAGGSHLLQPARRGTALRRHATSPTASTSTTATTGPPISRPNSVRPSTCWTRCAAAPARGCWTSAAATGESRTGGRPRCRGGRHHDFAAAGRRLPCPRARRPRAQLPQHLSPRRRFLGGRVRRHRRQRVARAFRAAGKTRPKGVPTRSTKSCSPSAGGCLSDGGRFVTTAIHFREPQQFDPREILRGPAAHPRGSDEYQFALLGAQPSAAGIRNRDNLARCAAPYFRARRRRRRHRRLPSHERTLASAASLVGGVQSARLVGNRPERLGSDRAKLGKCSAAISGIRPGTGSSATLLRCNCGGRRGLAK